MPMPMPPAGGMPYLRAVRKSSSDLLLLFLVADLVGEILGLHVRVVQLGVAGGDFLAVDRELVDVGEERVVLGSRGRAG